jgi:hypothetical protein
VRLKKDVRSYWQNIPNHIVSRRKTPRLGRSEYKLWKNDWREMLRKSIWLLFWTSNSHSSFRISCASQCLPISMGATSCTRFPCWTEKQGMICQGLGSSNRILPFGSSGTATVICSVNWTTYINSPIKLFCVRPIISAGTLMVWSKN